MNNQLRAHKCNMCGKCCRVPMGKDFIYVMLLPKDIEVIAKKLHISQDCFKKIYCIKRNIFFDTTRYDLFVLKAKDGKCVFLKENKCAIHSFKPTQCKLSPDKLFSKTSMWNHMPCYQSEDFEDFIGINELDFVKEILTSNTS